MRTGEKIKMPDRHSSNEVEVYSREDPPTDADAPVGEHPAAAIFPMSEESIVVSIAEDLAANGYDKEKPILLWRRQLLDGRTRLRACAIAGVDPVFRHLPDDCDPYLESRRSNLQRRDLQPQQRAACLLACLDGSEIWAAEQQRRREEANRARSESQKGRPKGEPREEERRSSVEDPRSPKRDNRIVTELAKEAGVSRTTMERAMRMKRDNPAKFEEMRLGIKPRQVSHEERVQIIRDLFEKNTHRSEIAKLAGVAESTVSQILSDLGLARSSPSAKLTADLKRFAASIHGLTRPAKDLTVELSGDVIIDREEMRKCQSNIEEAIKAARGLLKSISGRL